MSFLPGMFPGGALMSATAPAVPATLSFLDSTVSSGSSVTGPAGIQAGDLLVCWDVATDASAVALNPLSGFTSIVTDGDTGNDQYCVLSYKIADGSEASASISGMNGASSNTKLLMVFRPDVPISAVNVVDASITQTGGDPGSESITAGGGVVPLVVLGAYAALSSIDSESFSPAADGEIERQPGSLLSNAELLYKIYNSSPANVTIDVGDEGLSTTMAGCYLEVA